MLSFLSLLSNVKPCNTGGDHISQYQIKYPNQKLEIIVVVALVAVLVVIGIPSFQNQTLNSQLSSASSELLSSFMSAKAESIGRSNFVTICKSTNGTTCSTANGVGWEQGWLTFIDVDGLGSYDAGVDDYILIHEALSSGMTAIGSTDIANRITYRPNGTTNLGGTAKLIICDGTRGFGDDSRVIVLTMIGKASTLRTSDDSTLTSCTPP